MTTTPRTTRIGMLTFPGLNQLDLGGRLVVPVRGRMTLVVNDEAGMVISEHGDYRFVPLR